MTRTEVQRVIAALSGKHQLVARLLYGSGLRLMECLHLRVKPVLPAPGAQAYPSWAPGQVSEAEGDVDLGLHRIVVRDGKGEKDRVQTI
jgi:integrase